MTSGSSRIYSFTRLLFIIGASASTCVKSTSLLYLVADGVEQRGEETRALGGHHALEVDVLLQQRLVHRQNGLRQLR